MHHMRHEDFLRHDTPFTEDAVSQRRCRILILVCVVGLLVVQFFVAKFFADQPQADSTLGSVPIYPFAHPILEIGNKEQQLQANPSDSNSLSPSPSESLMAATPSATNSMSTSHTPSNSRTPPVTDHSPSSSPSPCHRSPCELATTEEDCSHVCSCQWVPERKFCFYLFSGRILIGPQDPRPVSPVWGGTFAPDDLPKPLPSNFAEPPSPQAKGKFAYVTMISPNVPVPNDPWRYCCFGLSLLTSIRRTNPAPNVDFVLVILVSNDDTRYQQKNIVFNDTMAPELIGQGFYDAFREIGVKRFIVWSQLDMSNKISTGGWTQAFSKLQMWTLTDYEKIIFMDADKLVYRNMDHLFDIDADFAAPGDWTCANARTPYFPAGGFWVIRPSMKIYNVITSYLDGPDPCGEKWYQGDQILPRLLFTDTTEASGPNNTLSPMSRGELIARWDGDVGMFLGNDVVPRIGRCASYASDSSHPSRRIDVVIPVDGSPAYIPPKSTWVMLNESYDITVGVCHLQDFIERGNRYQIGTGGWTKLNPFSVHMSCNNDGKPSCIMNPEFMSKSAPCLREVYERYYEYLQDYDMKVLLAH